MSDPAPASPLTNYQSHPHPADRPLLQISGLRVAYQRQVVLSEVTLALGGSRLLGLIGPNGAGKSTLLKAVLGMVPYQGQVLVEGLPTAQNRRCLAYVPQKEEVRWDFPVTVSDVVMMGRYRHIGWLRRPGRLDKQLVEEALAQVGMSDYRHRQISQLSGGQQQRVFVARALVQQGHIMLLDEPFTGIDAASQEIIMRLLLELRRQGNLIVMATHDLQAAAEVCDECALLNHRLVAFGPSATVFQPHLLMATFGSRVLTLNNAGPDHATTATTTMIVE